MHCWHVFSFCPPGHLLLKAAYCCSVELLCCRCRASHLPMCKVIKWLSAIQTHSKIYFKRDLWRSSWPTLYSSRPNFKARPGWSAPTPVVFWVSLKLVRFIDIRFEMYTFNFKEGTRSTYRPAGAILIRKIHLGWASSRLEAKKMYLHDSSARMLTLLIDTFQDYWRTGLDWLWVPVNKDVSSYF